MPIDLTAPESKRRELRNISLIQAKKRLQESMDELSYLILATHTGERRNHMTDANIHLMAAQGALNQLKSE